MLLQSAYSKLAKAVRPALGFTLLELLVVVMILSILAGVVVTKFLDKPGQARQDRAQFDIQQVVSALNLYKLDNYNYPSTEQGLQALVTQPAGQPEAPNWKPGGYLDKLPKDPWNHTYNYLSPGRHGEIDVYSYGSDAKPGGEGEAGDVGNWD